MELTGKTALITGGGKNIGRSIALMLADQGVNIVVCDINGDAARETAALVSQKGVKSDVIVCDVRDRKTVFEETERILQAFGDINILVNNAGGSAGLIGKLTEFVNAEEETIDFVLDINIKGSMNFVQAVLPSMIKNKCGKIINMSSIAALVGLLHRADYAAAKAAMIGFSRALALEVGKYNICVNCVSPGAIERDGKYTLHMNFLGEDGRSGSPDYIAETVGFLARNDYITGQNIVVDGGRVLGPGVR